MLAQIEPGAFRVRRRRSSFAEWGIAESFLRVKRRRCANEESGRNEAKNHVNRERLSQCGRNCKLCVISKTAERML